MDYGGERVLTVPQLETCYPRPPNKEMMREVIETGGKTWAITCNKTADRFYLYKVDDNGVLSKRIASASSPPELKTKMK